jgi:hypothetical protein
MRERGEGRGRGGRGKRRVTERWVGSGRRASTANVACSGRPYRVREHRETEKQPVESRARPEGGRQAT